MKKIKELKLYSELLHHEGFRTAFVLITSCWLIDDTQLAIKALAEMKKLITDEDLVPAGKKTIFKTKFIPYFEEEYFLPEKMDRRAGWRSNNGLERFNRSFKNFKRGRHAVPAYKAIRRGKAIAPCR